MSGVPLAREAELEALSGVLDAVTGGDRRLLVLRGEPGIGKTRLLAELGRHALERRFVVLDGRCAELERDVPLAAVVDAIEPALPRADDPRLRGLGADRRARLAELFPELGAPLPSTAAAASPAERWRLHRAVRDLLDLLAARTPVVLMLDDVHWADPATLELLDHLVRRPPRERHLLALALRPGGVADRMLAARGAAGAGPPVLLDIGPLEREAAEPLLGAITDPGDRERAFLASGGNPLLLVELARDGGRAGLPDGIVAAVRAEVDGLTPAARALLDAGAVAGDPFDLDLAAAVAGLAPGDALAGLDTLADRELIRPAGHPRQYAFRHPLFRSAVYAALPEGARLARHAGAAATLDAAGAPPAARARHLFHSAGPGDRAAARTLREAASAVRAQSPAIAADWLLAARRTDSAIDAVAQADLGAVLVEAGRLPEALIVLDEAVVAAGDDDALQVVLAVRIAAVQRRLGRHADAARRLELALVRQPPEAALEARLLTELATGAYYAGDYREMAVRAEQACAADAATDPVVHASAAAMAAAGRAFGGDLSGAAAAARDAVESVASATDEELAADAAAALTVAWALVAQERLADALAVAERCAAVVRRTGGGGDVFALDVASALALGLLGRLDAAVAAADRAEQAARVSGNPQAAQWALWMRAWTLLEHGELDPAVAAARESVDLAESLDDSALAGVARAVLGAVLIARGDHERGRRLIEGAADDVDPTWACRWAPWLVEADVACGDADAAAAHASRASAIADQIGLAGAAAAAARAQARVALAVGDHARALSCARRALAGAERLEGVVDVARARLLAGRALAASDRSAAVEELALAQRTADAAGARRVREEAVRELRRLGSRVGRGGRRAAGATGLDALSDREREVAELVATGATNREIGERLFLSEKTVETHLSQTFRKLQVRSRAAVAARVASGDAER